MSITEKQLAKIMPLGAEMNIREIREKLGLEDCSAIQVAQWLRPHKRSGFLTLRHGTNKSALWSRAKDIQQNPKPKTAKRKPLPFEVDRVTIGGSNSSHYGSSEDKPTTVSLAKMPTLRAV
jgi:hypothetical protein